MSNESISHYSKDMSDKQEIEVLNTDTDEDLFLENLEYEIFKNLNLLGYVISVFSTTYILLFLLLLAIEYLYNGSENIHAVWNKSYMSIVKNPSSTAQIIIASTIALSALVMILHILEDIAYMSLRLLIRCSYDFLIVGSG